MPMMSRVYKFKYVWLLCCVVMAGKTGQTSNSCSLEYLFFLFIFFNQSHTHTYGDNLLHANREFASLSELESASHTIARRKALVELLW